MTPAAVQCARTALKILRENPQRVLDLKNITDYVRNGMKERGIDIRESVAPIIPINTYDDYFTFLACKKLFENGVYVNPVVSPAVPAGDAIIRTSYTATHTPELMDEAMDIIKATFDQLKKEMNK